MAYPVYEGNGGIGSDTDADVVLSWPAGVAENDILVAIVGNDAENAWSLATTGGQAWAWVGARVDYGSDFSSACQWHRVTAAEAATPPASTTFIADIDSGTVIAGVMTRFSGCYTGGDPFESKTTAGVTQSTAATISEVVTINTDRLCSCFIGIQDNVGTSGGTNYAEVMDVTTSTGDDMGFSLFTYQQATADTVSAETATVGGNDFWATYTLAMRPSATGGYPNDVIGVGTADIGKVNAVGTADVIRVIGV